MREPSVVAALHEARRDGRRARIDDSPLRLDGALGVQLSVADSFLAAGERIGGWKAGSTSGRSRDALGAGFRPFGYVLESRISRSGVALPLDGFARCLIEPELCLILGSPLKGEVDALRARAAVRAVAPAFELVDQRVVGGAQDPANFVADGMGNWGIVVGDDTPVDEGLGSSIDGIALDLRQGGETVARATAGRDLTIDDPFLALSRACSLLAEHGRGMQAGQAVVTGSFVPAVPVDAPGSWTAGFSGVGEVSVTFE